MLMELERGIYNWTIRESNKNGFMCLWDDRQFNKIYTRKAISIYQNLEGNNKLVTFILDNKSKSDEGLNAYKISFMKPNELCPDKYTEIINKLKEKKKLFLRSVLQQVLIKLNVVNVVNVMYLLQQHKHVQVMKVLHSL